MSKLYRPLSLLALMALVAGCSGSPTGPEPGPKEDPDDGSEKQEVVASARWTAPAAG